MSKTKRDKGLNLLQHLLSEGNYLFKTDDARVVAGKCGISKRYVARLLSRLTQQGWIVRLKRNLYVGTGGLPGHIQIHPFVIATHLVEPSAISHWSAMQYHGFTEQIPLVITAITPKKAMTPSMFDVSKKIKGKHVWKVLDVICEYIAIQPTHFFGIKEIWVDEHFKISITDKERTFLDGFIDPQRFGGLGEILGILATHLEKIEVKKLMQYALQYHKAAVIKRLGWGLEQLGVPLKQLAPLLKYPIHGFRLLDPGLPRRGNYDHRWMIQNNLAKLASC